MNTQLIILSIYIFIGLMVVLYDYQKYQKEPYELAKKNNMADDSIMCMYMMTVMIAWPIKIIQYIFKKND